jgi:hypothetical protein
MFKLMLQKKNTISYIIDRSSVVDRKYFLFRIRFRIRIHNFFVVDQIRSRIRRRILWPEILSKLALSLLSCVQQKITIEKNGVFFSFKWFIFDFSQDNLFNNSISIRIRIRTFFRMLIRILSNLSDLDPQHWIEGCKKRYLLPIPYTSKYRPTELYGIQYIPIKITGRYLV